MIEDRHVAISVEKLWDLVRDAYDEGYGLALNERHSNIRVAWPDSLARDQVIGWLEWYWQAKNEVGEAGLHEPIREKFDGK